MAGVTENLKGGASSHEALMSALEDVRMQEGDLEAFIRGLTPTDIDYLLETRVLQAAQSDQNIGRIAPGGYAAGHMMTVEQRRQSERDARLTLQALLMNASYRVLHEQAVEVLDDAERDIAVAIEDMQGDLDDIRAAMADMEARALRDANGNIVFLDGDRYVYINGKPLSGEMALTVVAKPGVNYPTHDEYRALQEAEADRLHRIQELEGMRDRLDGYRDELHDERNPPPPSRVPEIIEDIGDISDQAQVLRDTTPPEIEARIEQPETRPDMTAQAIPSLPA